MKRIGNLNNWIPALLILVLVVGCTAKKDTSLIDENIRLVNRELVNSTTPNAIHLDAKVGEGLAILQDVKLENGTIEVDLLGDDTPGRSFVGLAFNIQNDSTFEAIYFRPFNFHSEEKIRREHSIQYVFHPSFSWNVLREESAGAYEAEYTNPPSATDWFSTKIVINSKEVSVIDPETGALLLKVDRLAEPKSDKIAYWVGHNSTGGFRNLEIKKTKVESF